jgi:hypothetical protein
MLLEIISSSLNPFFFRRATQKSAGRAFVYYLVFTTVYTFVICLAAFWWASKNWTSTVDAVRHAAPSYEVTMSQGHLSTTFPEPFVYSTPDLAMVLDTSGDFLNAESAPLNQKALLLSKTKLIFKKNQFQTVEYSWSALPDFHLQTDDALGWLLAHKQAILWTAFLTLALGFLPIIWMLFIPVVLVIALLLWIAAKLLGRKLSYGQTATIAFYATTLPILAQTFLVFYARHWATPRMFWGIYLLWALIGVWVSDSDQSSVTPIITNPTVH